MCPLLAVYLRRSEGCIHVLQHAIAAISGSIRVTLVTPAAAKPHESRPEPEDLCRLISLHNIANQAFGTVNIQFTRTYLMYVVVLWMDADWSGRGSRIWFLHFAHFDFDYGNQIWQHRS